MLDDLYIERQPDYSSPFYATVFWRDFIAINEMTKCLCKNFEVCVIASVFTKLLTRVRMNNLLWSNKLLTQLQAL